MSLRATIKALKPSLSEQDLSNICQEVACIGIMNSPGNSYNDEATYLGNDKEAAPAFSMGTLNIIIERYLREVYTSTNV